eukprot:GHVR01086846.1.p1 GENE.GHVR01086846.1~~GHVR01086846.1.p1  ORF type:complete len:302 (+),score=45.06 GHVR01086846.1:320-1225(+)
MTETSVPVGSCTLSTSDLDHTHTHTHVPYTPSNGKLEKSAVYYMLVHRVERCPLVVIFSTNRNSNEAAVVERKEVLLAECETLLDISTHPPTLSDTNIDNHTDKCSHHVYSDKLKDYDQIVSHTHTVTNTSIDNNNLHRHKHCTHECTHQSSHASCPEYHFDDHAVVYCESDSGSDTRGCNGPKRVLPYKWRFFGSPDTNFQFLQSLREFQEGEVATLSKAGLTLPKSVALPNTSTPLCESAFYSHFFWIELLHQRLFCRKTTSNPHHLKNSGSLVMKCGSSRELHPINRAQPIISCQYDI